MPDEDAREATEPEDRDEEDLIPPEIETKAAQKEPLREGYVQA